MSKRKLHKGTNRPVWEGPEKDCYYYVVKNIKHENYSSGWVVPFTEDKSVRQICADGSGRFSLIESEKPLPIQPNEGKLLADYQVEKKIEKLRKSLEKSAPDHVIEEGIPVTEEEVFE